MALIAPSILSADVLALCEQISIVENSGADLIHIDVMDGHFVPNLTFGPFMVEAVKRITELPLDCHLMIENADAYIPQFAKAGARIITVHQESCTHLHRTLQLIRSLKVKTGIALNPATPVESILPVLDMADLVLVMSVNPGFGGQKFIPSAVKKIAQLAELKKARGLKFAIEVDGGINARTADRVLKAGAEILVAGNAIFGQPDIAAACGNLKALAGADGAK